MKTKKADITISLRLNSDDESILNTLTEKSGLNKSTVIKKLIRSAELSNQYNTSEIPYSMNKHLSNILRIGMNPPSPESYNLIMEEVRQICTS